MEFHADPISSQARGGIFALGQALAFDGMPALAMLGVATLTAGVVASLAGAERGNYLNAEAMRWKSTPTRFLDYHL